tara:strand:+ start:2298 stop:2951 length:654 start_codon:yes stop_codon:yes gene_type:complete
MCDINKNKQNNKNMKKTKKEDYPKLPEKTLEECMSKYTLVKKNKSGKPSLKDTAAYKALSPFGTYKNVNGKYNYGNKSYLKKKDLCNVLMNPQSYFDKNIKECKKDKKYHKKRETNKKNRIRSTRKGICPPKRLPKNDNCPNDISLGHVFKGKTTTNNDCCYKKQRKSKKSKKPKKPKKLTKLQKIMKQRAKRKSPDSPDSEYSPDTDWEDYSPDLS